MALGPESVNNYIIVIIFMFLGILVPIGGLTVARFLRPHHPTPEKRTTYESGNEPIGDSWVRFKVKYYLFALLFVLFDVEAIFLYPWAVVYDEIGLFALLEMLLFVFLLVTGLIYAWRKKVLEWK
ncbi:MAG: NADH-quinone oxidoreductase subunit A [Thermicanus sp.]|nr:NADH-quinone oxidoreductase subunit A [Thermicanus sp.]